MTLQSKLVKSTCALALAGLTGCSFDPNYGGSRYIQITRDPSYTQNYQPVQTQGKAADAMDKFSEWFITGGGLFKAAGSVKAQEGNFRAAAGFNSLGEAAQNSYNRETAIKAAQEGRTQVNIITPPSIDSMNFSPDTQFHNDGEGFKYIQNHKGELSSAISIHPGPNFKSSSSIIDQDQKALVNYFSPSAEYDTVAIYNEKKENVLEREGIAYSNPNDKRKVSFYLQPNSLLPGNYNISGESRNALKGVTNINISLPLTVKERKGSSNRGSNIVLRVSEQDDPSKLSLPKPIGKTSLSYAFTKWVDKNKDSIMSPDEIQNASNTFSLSKLLNEHGGELCLSSQGRDISDENAELIVYGPNNSIVRSAKFTHVKVPDSITVILPAEDFKGLGKYTINWNVENKLVDSYELTIKD